MATAQGWGGQIKQWLQKNVRNQATYKARLLLEAGLICFLATLSMYLQTPLALGLQLLLAVERKTFL
jgi:hypothetical protein